MPGTLTDRQVSQLLMSKRLDSKASFPSFYFPLQRGNANLSNGLIVQAMRRKVLLALAVTPLVAIFLPQKAISMPDDALVFSLSAACECMKRTGENAQQVDRFFQMMIEDPSLSPSLVQDALTKITPAKSFALAEKFGGCRSKAMRGLVGTYRNWVADGMPRDW